MKAFMRLGFVGLLLGLCLGLLLDGLCLGLSLHGKHHLQRGDLVGLGNVVKHHIQLFLAEDLRGGLRLFKKLFNHLGDLLGSDSKVGCYFFNPATSTETTP